MLTEKTKNSNIKKALATGAIIALLPILAHAEQGTFIVEPFSCELELLNEQAVTDRMEFINDTDKNRSMYYEFKELFRLHNLIIDSLIMNECEIPNEN